MNKLEKRETKKFVLLETNKIFFTLSFLSVIILMFVYFFFFFKKDLKIFPLNEKIKVDFYNDSLDNGNSKFLKSDISKQHISANYILKEGFLRPYIGIGFEEKFKKSFDISDYNTFEIKINSSTQTPFFAYFVVKDSVFNSKKEFYDRKYLCHFFEISKEIKTYSLQFSEFRIPDWWYDKYNISPNFVTSTDLKKLVRITITTGLTPDLNQNCSLKIYSIRFSRNNTFVVIILALIQLGIMLAIFSFNFYKSRKKDKQIITINYKAIMADEKIDQNTQQNSFLEYIHSNFNDANLTLEILSEKLLVSKKVIAETISEKYQCNFKTYVNQIRISEAKRLLTQSNLNISEIAYKVGFNSPNNFNRVFKKICGVNSGEYRDSTDL